MIQSFALGAPELAGFSILGATAGASMSSWLLSGANAHVTAGCVVGAVVLPLICALPQSIAAASRSTVRWLQIAGLQSGDRLAKGDTVA